MKRLSRRGFRVLMIAASVCAVATPLLAYGPLVAWSPLHPGYRELSLVRARILYPSDRTLPETYRHVDEWIAEGETFHALRVRKRITIVVCRSWSDFHRFVPWIGGDAVAGVTLATGDAIYITPKVAEKRLDDREFVRHELSHAVLSQNTSPWRSYRASQQYPWLHEGLAVWFGRQRAFVSQGEFFHRAPIVGVVKTLKDGYRAPDLRLTYIAWRDFLDYLDQLHGHDRFLAFLHAANQTPAQIDALFQSFFGVSWDEDAAGFERAVLAGTFVPRELP